MKKKTMSYMSKVNKNKNYYKKISYVSEVIKKKICLHTSKNHHIGWNGVELVEIWNKMKQRE